MLKTKFARQVEWVSVKLGIIFAGWGIHPNVWTLLALVPAAAGLFALYNKMLLEAVILFFASGLIDAIDGAVARVTNAASNFGAFLDGVVDRYVEILLYIGLWVYLEGAITPLLPLAVWIILLVFGALMPSFITSYADHRNLVTEPEELKEMEGLIGRSERLDLTYVGMLLGTINQSYLVYTVVLVAVLTNLTALQRISYTIKYKDT